MLNRISKLLAFVLAMTLLMSASAYAFEATGKDNTTVTDSTDMGTVGTKSNPIKYVDGTGVEFDSWAKGKYFLPNCQYLNITKSHDVDIRLYPVYEPLTYQAAISAGGGKFGANVSVSTDVNFDNKTMKADNKEILEKDAAKDLSAVLSGLTPSHTDSSLIPFYYSFESSTLNKRIFVNQNDSQKKETDDTDLSGAVYDVQAAGELTLVWKDCANAEDWNNSQKALAYFIAVEGGLTADEYHARFGGDNETPYGSISIEKKLPGATINSYSWSLKKTNSVEITDTVAAFGYTGMDAGFDHAKLKESISYGSKPYTLNTAELEFITYQRPTVGNETIE